MSAVGTGGIGALASVAVADGAPPPLQLLQLSQLLQLLQRKMFNRPRPQQLLHRLRQHLGLQHLGLQHLGLQQDVLHPQLGFTAHPQEGFTAHPQDGFAAHPHFGLQQLLQEKSPAKRLQPQRLRLQQELLHPQEGFAAHPQDGLTAHPQDGLQVLQHLGLQHLGLQHFGLQHLGLQHLGLQQRCLQQDFTWHPHDGALVSQPHFVSHPQPLTPNMRSKSSNPKLWLHKQAVTTKAPIRLVNFIEQRLLLFLNH